VPLVRDFAARFHAAHEALFGHAAPGSPIEVVTLRVRAVAAEPAPPRLRASRSRSRPAPSGRTTARVDGRAREVPVYERERLSAEARIRGPAIVVELSATSWIPADATARVDGSGHLHLEDR
jgi:N-methylhydantoinase A